jgi:maleylacetoacetate isomerase
VTSRYINLVSSEQHSSDYVNLNPGHSVPTLLAENGTLKLTQSIAILEYLEERFPEKPLLPRDPQKRAIVRNLVNILSCDVQPITNLRILVHIDQLGGSRADWAKQYLQSGLEGIPCQNRVEFSV